MMVVSTVAVGQLLGNVKHGFSKSSRRVVEAACDIISAACKEVSPMSNSSRLINEVAQIVLNDKRKER